VFTASLLQYIFNNNPLVNQTSEQMLNETIEQKTITVTEEQQKFPFPLIESAEINNVQHKIITTADTTKEFNNLEEITKLAGAVFEGNITDVAYFDKDGMTYTKYMVKVSEKYFSNVDIGDVVNVIEPGGVTTVYNRIKLFNDKKEFPNLSEEESKKQYVQVNWDNTPLSKVGDKVLLFAHQDTENYWNLPKNYYYAVGYKDGKFNIEGGIIERKVPKDDTKDTFSMSKENFDNKIKDYIKLNEKQKFDNGFEFTYK
jgi:hypothetical protein